MSRLDPLLDLQPRMLETKTGDVTVHCSDTLHRAHPPVERPRKVVYSGFGLHLVRIDDVVPGRAVTLDEVRDEVLRDLQALRQVEAAAAGGCR